MMATISGSYGDLDALYEDESERQRHLSAIQTVALHAGSSLEEVERLYETVLKSFKQSARIRDFLPVLVSRRVEDLLRTRQGS
jgi:hypothetical protein